MVNKKFCDDCQLEINPTKVWVIKIWHELNNIEKYKHLCDACQKRYKWMQT